jgi:HD-GYP domain-containing protein (c-di-GMP phosphodiesterase class II)
VIADTVDLVGVDDTSHGKRVGVMARECARVKGLDAETQELLFEVGLLHDCGVSSTRVHKKLVTELDWSGAEAHCERGALLLDQFQPLSHMAPIVLYHHTHWKDLLAAGVPPETARYANLIYLVDRVDMLAAHDYAGSPPLFHAKEICQRIARLSGDFFAPEWVEAFREASAQEAFWLRQEPANIALQLLETPTEAGEGVLDLGQLHAFALIIAHIVDAKSPFTAEHSLGVARLSRFLGELAGLPAERNDKLEIAGLLHDIGKLQIPDEILEKPGKLDEYERTVMKSHSFMTWQILSPITGIEEIIQWAAFHHESINGVGYPFHIHGEALSVEARIVRVADVYQAMAQRRPYRDSTPPAEIIALLREMAAREEVDGCLVDLVEANLERCHAVALGLAGDVPAGARA